jgi:hypothetical protein
VGEGQAALLISFVAAITGYCLAERGRGPVSARASARVSARVPLARDARRSADRQPATTARRAQEPCSAG